MRAVLLSACALLAAASPALAQSREELAQRLTALEARMSASAPQDAARMNMERIDSLEQQLRVLTGQIEELQFQNRQLRERVETLNQDMLSAMTGGPFAGASDPLAAGAPTSLSPGAGGGEFAIVDNNDPFAAQRRAAIQPLGSPSSGGGLAGAAGAGRGLDMEYERTGADPELLFARGRTRLFEGEFSAALDNFGEFLDVSPNDPRAGEAWFWVGSIYRGEDQPTEAAAALVKSLQLDPQGAMAPEAMVHLGASLAAMGQKEQGCQTLAAVSQRYPDMDPVVRAMAGREARAAGCS